MRGGEGGRSVGGGGRGRTRGNRREYGERPGVYYHIEEREMYDDDDVEIPYL